MQVTNAFTRVIMRNAVLFCILPIFSLFASQAEPASRDELTTALGQKLMLDFRYFCEDETPSAACRKPMTTVPASVQSLLTEGRIGGVILFSENIQSTEQLVRLNYQLQTLMAEHDLPPLFIAIDQEGGRVARIPDSIATRFVGNMAIGATGDDDARYAQAVAEKLATSMRLLGFNVNFAPSVDVNVNPQNPVINVRSYGESAEQVARLGQITVSAFEQQDILSALKHFPGHGDTHVDSHTGLPKVTHTRDRVDAVDLLPFKTIIDNQSPAMVMTAHIQYPHLDATQVKTRDGEKRIVPATLSKPILTNILRKELGFKGLIVTDAMDMAGIAHYFSPRDALVKTFNAGADIALMPVAIRNEQDIESFYALRHYLLEQLDAGELDKQQLTESAQRIADTKSRFNVGRFIQQTLNERIKTATGQLPGEEAIRTEQSLADAAITLIKGNQRLPVTQKGRWRMIMPDAARCKAMVNAIQALESQIVVACRSLVKLPSALPWQQWNKSDVLIVGDITPAHTVAEMGGLDPDGLIKHRSGLAERHAFLQTLMETAGKGGATNVFVSMRAPYNTAAFDHISDVQLATFGYNVEVTRGGDARGAVFNTLAKTLLGRHTPSGKSPVTLPVPSAD
ncbi:beta-hexosaminidase [Salinimonas sp. HHU 13199]|uniref:beta-N-acetylhexosaminidase n=1 Tax=Salinimonas profundi TaxID=2729140 RepID=A0ABR8LS35_9ALTE|nr:glycoside hydrolase family 3 N-terminal domain-containing protein [Salinimonas profundi]MBD3586749.1 beta-hexosaminidase [Salinimonas profundi]